MHPVWQAVASFILRGRIPILIVLGFLTFVMWEVKTLEVDQQLTKVAPKNDPEFQRFTEFNEEFGEDGNSIVIAMEGDPFQLEFFNDLFDLTEDLKKVEGVREVIGLSHLWNLTRNDSLEQFGLKRVTPEKLKTQAEVDSVATLIRNLPFYEGLIWKKDQNTSLLVISFTDEVLNTGEKVNVYDNVVSYTEVFEAKHNLDLKYAGLPVFRVNMQKEVKRELILFLVLALAVMALSLLLFFRSFYMVLLPVIVVCVVIIWTVGFIGLFGYKITLITGIIPALVTVIGIPNSVYLITKYHIEFRRTRNKIRSLVRVIERIGIVTVMTNATTAVGFGVLAFTDIKVLKEFGIVASLSVMVAFFISLMLIPISFSFLPPPSQGQVKHLERPLLKKFIRILDFLVHNRRTRIYIFTGAIAIASIWGLSMLVPVSFMTDDIPKGSVLSEDLKYVESTYNGVMPIEILIDTKRKRGATRHANLKKVDELQQRLTRYPELSRTISPADFARFSRQAFFGGEARDYVFPSRSEFNFLQLYLKNTPIGDGKFARVLTDSAMQKIRVSGNIKDIGSIELARVTDSIQAHLDEIFDPEKYDATVTGTTKMFIQGNHYLIDNLIQSLAIAFLVIAVLMGLLFRSLRMVVISLVPNFLPLLIVAGIMGFAGFALKPSSVLVFSVAFGIAVDDSIHFLARFRLAKALGDSVPEAISNSFKDTGVSMIYTSVILFFGFVIFTASSFGGTQALGVLTSITLLIAMFSNLLFLPSLLLTFGKETRPVETPSLEPRYPVALENLEADEEEDAPPPEDSQQEEKVRSKDK